MGLKVIPLNGVFYSPKLNQLLLAEVVHDQAWFWYFEPDDEETGIVTLMPEAPHDMIEIGET
jgi:hypothetical protein